jgi:lipopolysaccharide/colanic/teichoic acid biosynthesis glycosyltransferase
MNKSTEGSVSVATLQRHAIVDLGRFKADPPTSAPHRTPETLPAAAAIPPPRTRVHPITRLIEVLVASLVLVLTAPVMLVIAVIIKTGTPGPALFRQKRLGRNGEPFDFVKFRTLYHDAKQRFPHLYAYRYNEDELRRLKFKVPNDPRVTPQGEWLRRSTLDELPNFWSVLKGDMALVGPRPEIPEMLPYYHGEMLEKLSVRPGITGAAQVSGRGRLGFHETVQLDVQYVRQRSLGLDMKILLKTVRVCLFGDGAF